jgi:hypothetical protein
MYLSGGVDLLTLLSFLIRIYNRFPSQSGPLSYSTQWLKAQGSRLKVKAALKFRAPAIHIRVLDRVPCAVFTRWDGALLPSLRRIPLGRLVPLFFLLFALPLSAAQAASVDLEWDPNPEPELAGYKIYWDTSTTNFNSSKDVGKTTTATISGLVEGTTYYFAATAYDGNGNESGYSNQISYTVPFGDTDGDGIPDNEDAFPSDPNETIDTDGDGTGNNADPDDDGDGMPDDWESQYGFNPLENDASGDADGDGVTNLDEYIAKTNPLVPNGNSPPDAPDLIAPNDQQLVAITPEIQTDEFYDPDPNDVHSETQWQIFRQADNVCVFDVVSPYSLTKMKVPKMILKDDTNYHWRARFIDNHGNASEWSASSGFTTEINYDDANGDGIPDHQEVAADSDMDGDGILDADQTNIKCVKVSGKNNQIGLGFKNASNVAAIETIEAEDPSDPKLPAMAGTKPKNFPYGVLHYRLRVKEPGDHVTVTVYFSNSAPKNGKYYKYDSIEGLWQDYSSYASFSANRKSVDLYLEDGGIGDEDGTANGIIIDPSGVGVTSTSTSIDSSGSSGSEDVLSAAGCFITTASARSRGKQAGPVWNEIRGRELAFILVLLGLLKALTIVLKRTKQRWEEMQRRYEMYHARGTRFTAKDLMGKG